MERGNGRTLRRMMVTLFALALATNAAAQTAPDPAAMGGYFGSVMGTSFVVGLSALLVALVAAGIIGVAMRGPSWD